INFEYPVNPAITVNGELASWGKFKPDALPIERLAELAPKAQMIIDRVGW
ncbi:MAG: iron ABC transporter substrate-binding protein, partial [Candidatus Puniceispirillum sp.]|nr:iron ABC transporter substrate-binding protein [Candidatus Puniceispirillum sp.]